MGKKLKPYDKHKFVANPNSEDWHTIWEENLQFTGEFDFVEFYNKMYWAWFGEGFGIHETMYEVTSTGPNKKTVIIFWDAFKNYSSYTLWYVNIQMKVFNLTDVEYIKDGKTIKTQKALMKFSFKGTMILDYNYEFGKSNFLKRLRRWYDRFYYGVPYPSRDYGHRFNTFKKEMDSFDTKLKEQINEIRAYLGMPER